MDTIPAHFTTQFSTNWTHRIKQTKCRLDNFIIQDDFDGERKRYDRIGSTSASERTERKGPTRITDLNTDDRWAYRVPYDEAKLLDKDDAKNLGQLVLPNSALVVEFAADYQRKCDDRAILAAYSSVKVGELGTTDSPFPTSTNHIGKGGVVGDETGTPTGLTIAKLLTMREILDDADADEDSPRVIVTNTKQVTNLLNTTEVKSADYNTVKALAAGQNDTFMGFKFVRNKRLPVVNGVRKTVAWIKGAVTVMRGGKMVDISIRKDLSYATQIYHEFYLGGVRLHDEAVVTCNCLES